MADEKLVKMLKEEGVEKFNQWREDSPGAEIDLEEADLRMTYLCAVNLNNANLYRADLAEANLIEADLTEANMINVNLDSANLYKANLRSARLCNAILNYATLSEANLNMADLSDSMVIHAKFIKASLYDTILWGVNFYHTNLCEANLKKATLIDANLTNTILKKSNFENASILSTKFSEVDLSQTEGLDKLKSGGSSSVDHVTLIKSKNLPEKTLKAFLESCGMPEQFIDYIPSMVQSLDPIQYYESFISYGGEDKKFVERLHHDLKAKKVRCWFASEDAVPGKNIKKTINTQIRLRDKLILVLSKNSIQKDWVVYEAKEALREEKRRGKPILIPIMLDDAIFTYHGPDSTWVNKLRERFIGDFRGCDRDDALYKKAFERLLKSLIATEIEPKEG
jgi:uncharacterized protein YjbI with pentapeptide repeats